MVQEGNNVMEDYIKLFGHTEVAEKASKEPFAGSLWLGAYYENQDFVLS